MFEAFFHNRLTAQGLIGGGLLMILTALLLMGQLTASAESPVLRGAVVSQVGPVAGAVVRFRSNSYYAVTDNSGLFEIAIPEEAILDETAYLTAWAPGYLVGWTDDFSDLARMTITLTAYYTTDNPTYDWFSHEGAAGSLSCSHCMPCYSEWKADAHAQSAINPRFLSLYNGTTLTGKQGTPTVYTFDPELGVNVPVAPSLGQDGVGAGFRLDYPDLGGNCANCHVPGAAARPGGGYHVDLTEVSGVDLEGVFCEFCHKVGGVKLVADTGLPDPNLPGVLSMRLYRPEEGEQIFFGNFDDVPRGRRVSYLPFIQESAFCAACHFGEFWGTVAYNSFGEWLASPYSDPAIGQTCQDCHMPTVEYNYFVYPENGGNYRDAERIFSHQMPGALDSELLADTATLNINTRREGNSLVVTVQVTNTGAGHHIPTDMPLRNVILLVEAAADDGEALELIDGAVIPEWGGVGDPASGHYAGLPGVLYAKILSDFYTGETPTYAYWRQTTLVSDNRIPALATDESVYRFAVPSNASAITVDVQLLLRRAFIDLMDTKNWNTPDMLMEHETALVE